MLQLLRLLVLGLLLAVPLVMQAQPCATSYSLTVSPLPTAGTYACGQSVTFCFTVTGWNSTNANWFHGITASFGPGWDMSTLSPGPPPATCGASAGTWGWENSVQGTAGSNIGAQGPGFFFDLDNDGNPGNNFGDFCVGVTDWEFCWTINVLDGPACINGLGLGVTFNTFGDSETGGWGSAACNTDPIIPSPPALERMVPSACAPVLLQRPLPPCLVELRMWVGNGPTPLAQCIPAPSTQPATWPVTTRTR
jgi:hypothetical protein